MHRTRVVNLGQVRDLMTEWETVRGEILAGRVDGFALMVRAGEGREAIFVGGALKADPTAALKAILKLSAARTQVEDEPPLFQANSN